MNPPSKETLYAAGAKLMETFCSVNSLAVPKLVRLTPTDRYYHLGTCAFYRASLGINIAVEKCARPGMGGRAWSWPGYAVDRTPYGVIQHELGHHVDEVRTFTEQRQSWELSDLFSHQIWSASKEKPLTGYLGTDQDEATFYKEWFAEHFRLFVTNPDLSFRLAPKFHSAVVAAGLRPVSSSGWYEALLLQKATLRIMDMAAKKVVDAQFKPKTKVSVERELKTEFLL